MTSQDQPEAHGLNDGPALELRVHGVNNTTPASMLDLPVDDVEEVVGDKFAGFWRPKPGRAPAGEEDRGWIPAPVTREAYSWGGLARTTPGGGTGAVGKAIAIVAQIGWTLLLPYGLANVGYWTRNLSDADGGTDQRWGDRMRAATNPRGAPRPGAGASTVRVFGLALTVFMVVTVCEISMDLVATQCYESGEKVCGNLPGLFNGLATHSLAVRLAAMSLVPVALLLGLWWLSSITRSRYERATLEVDAVQADPSGDAGGPLLGRLGFWQGDRMVGGLVYIHLATGFAVVAFALAWPALFGSGSRCEDFDDWGACVDQIGGSRSATSTFFILVLLAAVGVLVAAVVLIVRGNRRMPDLTAHDQAVNGSAGGRRDPQTMWLWVVAATVLVITEVGLLTTTPRIDESGPLLGVNALPTVVLGLLVCLVVSALVLRVNRLGSWFAWSLAACLVVLAFAEQTWLRAVVIALALLIAAATLLSLVLGSKKAEPPAVQAGRPEVMPRCYVAWAGGGPGVMLGAALFAQTVLSSLTVLLVGDWLNGSLSARTLLPGTGAGAVRPVSTTDCEGPCPDDPLLSVPLPYVLLGTAVLLTLLLVLLAALVAYWIGRPKPHEHAPVQDAGGRNPSAGGPVTAGGTSQAPVPMSHRKVRRARRFARLAHRAEKLLGLFVALSTASVLAAVIATAAGWLQPGTGSGAFTWLRAYDVATSASVLVAAAALAALVKGAGSGEKRPLGLVWDLMAFLPRAAHPFAPPCYAERAVPELTDRINWWFSPEGRTSVGGQRRRGSKVIVSAHSLGGVLAVASLLQLRWKSGPREIALLTYGSQLRAYFGRIFPELLGDPAIGIRRARGAVLFADNPWKNELIAGATVPDSAAPGQPGTVTEPSVGPALHSVGVTRWVSLWRPTDYLGFPVRSYGPGNGLDVPADELDRTGYLVESVTHGHYPRSSQYRAALLELTEGVRERDA